MFHSGLDWINLFWWVVLPSHKRKSEGCTLMQSLFDLRIYFPRIALNSSFYISVSWSESCRNGHGSNRIRINLQYLLNKMYFDRFNTLSDKKKIWWRRMGHKLNSAQQLVPMKYYINRTKNSKNRKLNRSHRRRTKVTPNPLVDERRLHLSQRYKSWIYCNKVITSNRSALLRSSHC